MINTEHLDEYLPLLGIEKLTHMWETYYNETLAGLDTQVTRWILQEDKLLLRNFFHSRRAGALTFGMTGFATDCEAAEEHLAAGGGVEVISSRLAAMANLFAKEAEAVKIYLKERSHD